MKACNDLDFLANYWIEAKKIGQKIKEELPKGNLKSSHKLKAINPGNKVKIFLVNFSDLKNSWSPIDILTNFGSSSEPLTALSDKLNNMIEKGRSKDIKPMLERIITKGIKNLIQPGYSETKWVLQKDGVNEKCRNLGNIGKGHFRWNYRAYTLNEEEIQKIKTYFKL